MSKYENTIIYKIVCNDLNINDCYVGSTVNFKSRKYDHKRSCTNSNDPAYNQSKYQFIRDNGGWENWSMIEIEKYPCKDNNEARARERYHYEQLNSNLNNRLPKREYEEKQAYNKEYFENNKDELKEKRKVYMQNPERRIKEVERVRIYRQNNKDEILKRQRENNIVCECGSTHRSRDRAQHLKTDKHQNFINNVIKEPQTYYERHKEQIKDKYETNKSKINERRRKLYEQQKDIILQKHKETVVCQCGVSYCKHTRARHEKSKKHINFINKNN